MRRLVIAIALCLLSIRAVCQVRPNYQIATILEIKAHQSANDSATSYDVSVKVGDTVYLVRYTPALGEVPPKYAAGREMLVLVGNDTITYNDILGHSVEVAIQSHRPAVQPKGAK